MTRDQLEHIIRAASSIADDYEIVIVGSQSILGEFPNAPASLLQSMEADVYPYNAKEKSDLIDGTIGEYSRFHEMYGYYAQGVSPTTAVLPKGWEGRLNSVRTTNSVGYCIDVHDLAISKLVANREKDLQFVQELFKHNMVNKDKLVSLAYTLPPSKEDPDRMVRVFNTIQRIDKSVKENIQTPAKDKNTGYKA